jgi:hypothetical protein
MISSGIAVGLALSSMLLAIIAITAAAIALVDVHAFRRSTHQIQYMPVDQATKSAADPIDKVMAEHDQKVYDNLEAFYPGKEETI